MQWEERYTYTHCQRRRVGRPHLPAASMPPPSCSPLSLLSLQMSTQACCAPPLDLGFLGAPVSCEAYVKSVWGLVPLLMALPGTLRGTSRVSPPPHLPLPRPRPLMGSCHHPPARSGAPMGSCHLPAASDQSSAPHPSSQACPVSFLRGLGARWLIAGMVTTAVISKAHQGQLVPSSLPGPHRPVPWQVVLVASMSTQHSGC